MSNNTTAVLNGFNETGFPPLTLPRNTHQHHMSHDVEPQYSHHQPKSARRSSNRHIAAYVNQDTIEMRRNVTAMCRESQHGAVKTCSIIGIRAHASNATPYHPPHRTLTLLVGYPVWCHPQQTSCQSPMVTSRWQQRSTRSQATTDELPCSLTQTPTTTSNGMR